MTTAHDSSKEISFSFFEGLTVFITFLLKK